MTPVVDGETGADLGDRIIDAAQARHALILAGANTNDLFLGPNGFVYLRELVAQRHAAAGRLPVVCTGHGIKQDPLPDQAMTELRRPDDDTPPGQALFDLCDQLRTLSQPVVLIVDFADLRLPAAGGGTPMSPDQQLLMETLVTFPVDLELREHRLVVISRVDGLDQRLARFTGWEVIVVDLPDEALRTQFARRLDTRRRAEGSAGALEPGLTPERLGQDCGGLTLDDMMRGSERAAGSGKHLTQRWVHETKVARLRQRCVDGLDIYSPGGGLSDVAGLPQLRLFMRERALTGSYPRAIILAGPPGVGKTLVVRAIADETGWPAVALGNVRSMWLGETEARIRNVLSTARAMAPLVFHIDEVDAALGRRETGPSGDGGTGARILAEFWTFLGDANPAVPILFVLTTNRPDLLDPATRSRSEVIPVLHPTPSEQVSLLQIACRGIGWPIGAELAEAAIGASGLNLVSGRMLVRVAQRAAINAQLEKAGELSEGHLKMAFAEFLERLDSIDDERMALKALALASFTTYLPWVAAERLGEPVEILPYIAPLLDAECNLNQDRLNARIAELDDLAAQRQVHRTV